MDKTDLEFHIPTRPYSPIDALNRAAAAVGSPGYAMASSHADYNGHHVTLQWNSYRGYYVAEYFWAGRIVIGRGDFAHCLAAVVAEYNRGALGASASIYVRADDAKAVALCESTKEVVKGSAWENEPGSHMRRLSNGSWYTWRHRCAAQCARDYANPGSGAMIFDWEIMQAVESEEAYETALRAKYGRVYQ